MKIKIIAIFLAIVMAMALAACGGGGGTPAPAGGGGGGGGAAGGGAAAGGGDTPADADVETVVIRVATTVSDTNPMQQLVYFWQDRVDDLMPGRVEWQNFPNSALGGEREIGEMVIDGTVDAALIGVSNYNAIVPNRAGRLQEIPFLFRDSHEMYAALNEWKRDMIDEETAPFGFTTIFHQYFMSQALATASRPMSSPEELSGMVVRVFDSMGLFMFFEAFGALPVMMPLAEVFTGLQQGTIDGSYTTSSNFYPQGQTDVLNYYTNMPITQVGMGLIFSLDSLASFPQDLQDALFEAGRQMEDHALNVVSPEVRAQVHQDLAGAGVQIIEVSPEDHQRFVSYTEERIYAALREEIGADLWDFAVEWLEEFRSR